MADFVYPILNLSIVYCNLHWNMHLFVDLIFKRSCLAFECSDLYGVFSFKSFGQKHVFLIKIQRFLELHQFIPAVVIIIEK